MFDLRHIPALAEIPRFVVYRNNLEALWILALNSELSPLL